MREYYDRRAPEYDDWYLGRGLFADRDRPGWDEELGELAAAVGALPSGADARRRLRDRLPDAASARRRRRARSERPDARGGRARRLRTPRSCRATRSRCRSPTAASTGCSPATSTATSPSPSGARFLAEARRVARELVVVDASRAHSEVDEEMSQRVLEDGSRWQVYKRWFDGAATRRRARRRRGALRGPLVRDGAQR